MKDIQARVVAIITSFVIATLASWGVTDLSGEATAAIERWLSHTFELMLFLGYAVLHPILQRRLRAAPRMPNDMSRPDQ